MPGRLACSATPSAFQNAVAASTLRDEQRRDRVEADRHLAHLGRIAAVAAHYRAQDGVVGGQARDAGALALEVARARDLRLGDDRGQRTLDDRHDPHDVAPLLAGEGEIVDVEDRELRAPREQELDAVGGGDGAATLRSTPSAPVKSRSSAR